MFSAVRPAQQKKRCLLTGASGFIGQNLCLQLQELGWEISAVRWMTPLPQELLLKGGEEITCDLRDRREVQDLFRRVQPEIVVHAAGNRDVVRCERDPQAAVMDNVVVTENVLQAAEASTNCRRFFFLSTDMVFDGAPLPTPFYTEQSRALPQCAYAKSKFQAECTVLGSTLAVHILRLSLVYGPGENNTLGWMRRKFQGGERLPLFFDEFRTPLCVFDIARVIEQMENTNSERRLVHLGGPTRLSRVEFGKIVAEVFGFDVRQIDLLRREESAPDCPRPADLSMSSEHLTTVLESPLLDIRAGLSRVAEGSV